MSVSFKRPEFEVNGYEAIQWEITAARTSYQYAVNENKRSLLVTEAVANDLVKLLLSSKQGAVQAHMCQALGALFEVDRVARLMYADGGFIFACGEMLATAQNESAHIAGLLALAYMAEGEMKLIPKICGKVMLLVPGFMVAKKTEVRVAAGRLAAALAEGGHKAWDQFMKYNGVVGLKMLLRLADEDENGYALKIIQKLCDNERYMSIIRMEVTMEPIVLLSRHSKDEISEMAKDILERSKYSVFANVPNIDAFESLTTGKASKLLVLNKYTEKDDTIKPKTNKGKDVAEALEKREANMAVYPFIPQ